MFSKKRYQRFNADQKRISSCHNSICESDNCAPESDYGQSGAESRGVKLNILWESSLRLRNLLRIRTVYIYTLCEIGAQILDDVVASDPTRNALRFINKFKLLGESPSFEVCSRLVVLSLKSNNLLNLRGPLKCG